ncbi:oogenesis-related isoform X1 [Kryptolebias marmoratus]|uniref:Oogenesis-related gene n=1 Tax=Kryptolebias marmoratus TaxID=37003 RepID=A0A3Q2ZKD9_KRYMA|nr:oogenesis-related isoform X1 [Kryptolebias marmoratus]
MVSESSREGGVVATDSVLRSLLRGLFWPFSIVVRAFRGFWGLLGSRKPQERVLPGPTASSPARPSLAARKRLRWVSRLVLLLLPRRVQGALGFPVSSSIGQSLSPEISVSPTKLHGKGSKRKQDDLDVDDSGDEEHPTWVEVLSMELADEGPEEDPDYEPSPVETDSEEYASHNNTESELQVSQEEVTGTVNVVATKVSSCI